MKPRLASLQECTGCLACVDSCNHKALVGYIHRDGHFRIRVDEQQCVGCGLCEKSCPVVSAFSYESEERVSKPFAAWNTNPEQRQRSTSGGAFPALATTVLNKGGKVVGVAIENSQAQHRMISSTDELPLLQGSKYQQSYTVGIYRQTLEELRKGTLVLFQGTPCQVAGLLSFLGKRTFKNLITCDIICGGVPSRLPLAYYLESTGSREVVGYRDKVDGWGGYHLTSVDKSGRVERDGLMNELVLKSFSSGNTNRYSCYDCKFNGLYRKADITIADFWGDEDFKAQHTEGLSFVTAHSSRGLALLKESSLEMHPTTFAKAVRKNPRMYNGKVFFAKYRFTRRFLAYCFTHCSRRTLMALYAGICPSNLWIPFKVYRVVRWKIVNRLTQKRNKRLSEKLLS